MSQQMGNGPLFLYQKRLPVYRVYSWELAESPVDRLRGEDIVILGCMENRG